MRFVMESQRSIKNIVSIEGKGLHSGKISKVTLKPAQTDKGVYFKRVDLENIPVLQVDSSLTGQTSRNTTIEKNGVSISTIEHLMATLRAFG
ncbi:MAG: UDP-3-O-acyl-N-acetylglucosamine deacetylase, partial [Bacteroidota bacterium]|nr:UDP-3-O-acyl-N-acetylglucosamine deacetylase [Bacteroidota bacterium]